MFPRNGSRLSLTLQVTPPYSWFRKERFFEPSDEQVAQIETELRRELGPGNPPTADNIQSRIDELKAAKRFEWLEYHKWKFSAEWYYNIFNKVVIATSAKLGILNSFDKDIGIPPFERFELGGDGINNQNAGLQGREILALRGYGPEDIAGNGPRTSNGQVEGAPIFNKYTVELRYPLSLNPNSTIYVTSFLQGGNAYQSTKEFNPFNLRRSAGIGARVFLPMFGLLGFDYGWGFDKDLELNQSYGRFNIVLGFEPE